MAEKWTRNIYMKKYWSNLKADSNLTVLSSRKKNENLEKMDNTKSSQENQSIKK